MFFLNQGILFYFYKNIAVLFICITKYSLAVTSENVGKKSRSEGNANWALQSNQTPTQILQDRKRVEKGDEQGKNDRVKDEKSEEKEEDRKEVQSKIRWKEIYQGKGSLEGELRIGGKGYLA